MICLHRPRHCHLQDVIINNTCDPMQNPGQTGIIYKAGQTWLTRAKRDTVDSTRLQC